MALTPNFAWPVPDMDDPANVPGDMKALGDAIDATVKGKEIDKVPIGAVLLWAAAAAPTNWLILNGQQVNEGDYPDLALILGSAGGLVTLPDLRDRFPIGAGVDNGLKAVGGEKTHVLTQAELPAHTHSDGTLAAASHTHAGGTLVAAAHFHSDTIAVAAATVVAAGNEVAAVLGGTVAQFSNANGGSTGVQDWPVLASGGFWDGINGNHAHTVTGGVSTAGPHAVTGASAATAPDVTGATGSIGSGTGHENRPPFLALNFIIRGR